jgi:type I restriction enzyme, S subunit
MKRVREGYKITELGEIPVEWEVNKLEDICERIFVGIATSTIEYYTDYGVPIIRNQNIKKDYLDTKELLMITKEFSDMNGSKKLKEGDILTVRTGYPGISCVVTKEYENSHTFTTLISRPKKQIINPYYLSRYINSEKGMKFINSGKAGGAQQNLNVATLTKMPVIMPLIHEQKKISIILSSIDEKIENTDNLIEKTKQLKKGLMQGLLTKGIGHEKFKDTEIGRIPEEWEVKSFQSLYSENIRDFGSFSTTKLIEYVDNGIPYLRSENFRENRLLINSISYITKEVDELLSKSYVYRGNILFTKIGNIGCACVYKGQLGERCNSNATIAKIKVDNTISDEEYISYFLNSVLCKRQYVGSIISTPPRINMGEINNFKIAIPSLVEQKQIASILSSVDEKIEKYKSKKEKLQELKKGLMQKLLTGKIRVKV